MSVGTFESLRMPYFRLFWFTTLSYFGAAQAQQFANAYLVYDLTNSYGMLGTVALVGALPNLLFSLFGGVLADRFSKKLMLQIGQVGNGLVTLVVAVVVFLGLIEPWHLLAAAVAQGVIISIAMPARQAIIPDLVPAERLTNAVSLNTAAMTIMRLTVPGIAGLLFAFAGAGWVYALMTALFVLSAVIVGLIPYRHVHTGRALTFADALAEAGSGFSYAFRESAVGLVLLLNLIMVIFTMPLLHLYVGFAKDVLGADALLTGILGSLIGVGSLMGALLGASLPGRHRGLLLLGSAMLLGVAQLLFATSGVYWVSAIIVVAFGMGHAGRMAFSNTLLLSHVQDVYRGRVMAIYMTEFSFAMVGVFLVGQLAGAIGPQLAFGLIAAALIGLSAASYLFLPVLRRLD